MSTLRIERDRDVARVVLARPEARNALNAELIGELRDAFVGLAEEPAEKLRAIVLSGEGEAFCAGADIAWQQASVQLSMEDNTADVARLREMLEAVEGSPAPVIARVHGTALGGGMALCCVADITLAAADTRFGFTEVKLGLIPSVISPFVLARLGEGQARALFSTGERFGADRALRIGLVHEVLADGLTLDARVAAILGELRTAGPHAIRDAKAMLRDQRDLDWATARALTVAWAARQRITPEGQEGLTAFLEKRRPSWRRD